MIKEAGKFLLNRTGRKYRVQNNLMRFTPAEKLPQSDLPTLEESTDRLLHDLESQKCFVGRWGTVEYECMLGALDLRRWFEPKYSYADRTCMSRNAGFFPGDDANLLNRFAQLYAKSSSEFTHHRLLGKGQCPGDAGVARQLNPNVKLLPITALALDRGPRRWLDHLNGKRVLFVSPFVRDMQGQFPILDRIWGENLQVPDFEPVWLEAVQSRGSSPATHKYDNWFEALGFMEGVASTLNFDCALLSCGAYSVPLGRHIFKHMSRTVICVGGDLQLLFGLRGLRWDETPTMGGTYNEFWSYPRSNIGDQSMLARSSCYTTATND